MRLLIVGALAGTALGWIFRRQLLALGSGGVEAVTRAADAARNVVEDAADAARNVVEDVTDRRPLEELTKEELYERARVAEIPGRSDMSKEQLIAALRERA